METPRVSKSATDVGGYCSCIEYSAGPGPLILTVCPGFLRMHRLVLLLTAHTHIHTCICDDGVLFLFCTS